MLQPSEKINWKDTNLALFGSELEKKIKNAAAGRETAWDGLGKEVTLRVWRIEKFLVKTWPNRKYGSFHKGDSYIILNSYKKDPGKPKISHDIHIWIGDESSQDEYGTAAYKMVCAYLGRTHTFTLLHMYDESFFFVILI
jgi:gelsolin